MSPWLLLLTVITAAGGVLLILWAICHSRRYQLALQREMQPPQAPAFPYISFTPQLATPDSAHARIRLLDNWCRDRGVTLTAEQRNFLRALAAHLAHGTRDMEQPLMQQLARLAIPFQPAEIEFLRQLILLNGRRSA